MGRVSKQSSGGDGTSQFVNDLIDDYLSQTDTTAQDIASNVNFTTGKRPKSEFIYLYPTTAPPTTEGHVYYDSTSKKLKMRNNSKWVSIGLGSIIVPFVDGSVAHDRGWEIDADTEYVRAYIRLPETVHSVVNLKIYAMSVVTEADAMHLEIYVNGGADNEPYNTHAYHGENIDSTSTNFAANDIIYWTITDSNVTALTGGDSIEIKVLHEGAGGADCATDAHFRTVEIEFL